MKLAITMNFAGEVHVLRIRWDDTLTEHDRIKLKNRLEVTPSVLKIEVDPDVDWKAEALSYKKQLADALKRINATTVDELPCFGIFHSK